jgi:hypothetical protein
MFAWNLYGRSDCNASLGNTLAPIAEDAWSLIQAQARSLPNLKICEDQGDPAATHYLEKGNPRSPTERVWLRPA